MVSNRWWWFLPSYFPCAFTANLQMHAGRVSLTGSKQVWLVHPSAQTRLEWTLVSIKHHLITSSIFNIIISIIAIITIIIRLLASLKYETIGSSYWTAAHSPLQPPPGPILPQQAAACLRNYPRIDSPNGDHFFTSCRITKRLIISRAHLRSFPGSCLGESEPLLTCWWRCWSCAAGAGRRLSLPP